jgi:transcriptional regulator with XRE-family HTH domain
MTAPAEPPITPAAVSWSPRLGAHVATARTRAGMRRATLAADLGVSEETVRLWERGAVRPSTDHLTRLIVVLALDAAQWTTSDNSGPDLPALARRLRHERGERLITQAEASRELDVPQPTYAGWETGRATPSAPFLPSIAAFLGASLTEVATLCASHFVVETTGWPPFGQLVGGARQELRLARSALADEMGISVNTVVSWELGYRVPRPQQLRRLAEVLKLDVESMLEALPRRGSSPTALGHLIVSRQQQLGLRLADVADRAGTTEATVSRWVHGRNRPAATSLQRLADAIEVPFADVAQAAGYAA